MTKSNLLTLEVAGPIQRGFWVLDIFGGQKQWAKLFEGGQVYQGSLSATHFLRWEAPLDGILVRSWVQPGTYFAHRPLCSAERPQTAPSEDCWQGSAPRV